jgi:hypothetical protein
MRGITVFCWLVAWWLAFTPIHVLAGEKNCPPEYIALDDITFDGSGKSLTIDCPGPGVVTLNAENDKVQDKIKWYGQYKDGLKGVAAYARVVSYVKNGEQYLENIKVHIPFTMKRRIITLLAVASFLFLVTYVVSNKKPFAFLLGQDNRYSTSKCQMACWFATLALVYIATLVFRFWESDYTCWGGIGIPENLLLLTGMSGFTFAAAKGIRVRGEESADREAAGADAGADSGKKTLRPSKAESPHLFRDLLGNDYGELDIGDFQMLFITLLAVAVYLIAAVRFLGLVSLEPEIILPDVDPALLSGFGLGQGAYLFKKIVTPVGK